MLVAGVSLEPEGFLVLDLDSDFLVEAGVDVVLFFDTRAAGFFLTSDAFAGFVLVLAIGLIS